MNILGLPGLYAAQAVAATQPGNRLGLIRAGQHEAFASQFLGAGDAAAIERMRAGTVELLGFDEHRFVNQRRPGCALIADPDLDRAARQRLEHATPRRDPQLHGDAGVAAVERGDRLVEFRADD